MEISEPGKTRGGGILEGGYFGGTRVISIIINFGVTFDQNYIIFGLVYRGFTKLEMPFVSFIQNKDIFPEIEGVQH